MTQKQESRMHITCGGSLVDIDDGADHKTLQDTFCILPTLCKAIYPVSVRNTSRSDYLYRIIIPILSEIKPFYDAFSGKNEDNVFILKQPAYKTQRTHRS